MKIFEEIRKLNLPASDYVVIGGAAVAARGLKETSDIDIVVSANLMAKYRKKKFWKNHPRVFSGEEPGLINVVGTVQLYPSVGGVDIPFEELRSNAELIDEIPFASLRDIVRIKEVYGREKDLIDIKRIKRYLKSVLFENHGV